MTRLSALAAMIALALPVAACGSSPSSTTSARSAARTAGLTFSLCMRSHGVSSFPDPAADGSGFNVRNVPGIDPSSPSFKAAQTACQHLLPRKLPPEPSGPPSARAYTQLLRLAGCLRAHGFPGLSDPKPDPPPSSGDSGYGTLIGSGGYWVGIPDSIDAHGPAFNRAANACDPGRHLTGRS